MPLRLGLGLGSGGFRSGIDVDAMSYISRATITDATARQQINDFVKGAKALGLWNNMVCWSLRSSQNIGTGTTAFSLGGLGTFNGTLVNGPTWGSTGMNFLRASNQSISIPILPINPAPSCVFDVAQTSLTLGSDRQNIVRWGGSSNISANGIYHEWPYAINNVEVGGVGFGAIAATLIPQRHLSLSGIISSTATNKLAYFQSSPTNASTTTDGSSFSPAALGVTIGGWSGGGGSSLTGEVSFVAALNGVTPSSSLYASFRTLYNSTLGVGINI